MRDSFSEAQMDRAGYAVLFKRADGNQKGIVAPVFLSEHPFRLYVPPPSIPRFGVRPILFFGFPGYTEQSVDSLLHAIGEEIACDWPTFPNAFDRLRVIKCETHGDPSRHDIYYEVMTQSKVMLCGGCNNYSGRGSEGKLFMNAAFRALVRMYGLEIETTIIPAEVADPLIEKLKSKFMRQ